MGEFNPPLFSAKFTQGRRTFFFDVKSTKDSKPYIKITASSQKGEEKQRTNMAVFDSEVDGFYQALSDAVSYLAAAKK